MDGRGKTSLMLKGKYLAQKYNKVQLMVLYGCAGFYATKITVMAALCFSKYSRSASSLVGSFSPSELTAKSVSEMSEAETLAEHFWPGFAAASVSSEDDDSIGDIRGDRGRLEVVACEKKLQL